MATIHSPLLTGAAKVVGARVPVRLPYTGIRTVGLLLEKVVADCLAFVVSSVIARSETLARST